MAIEGKTFVFQKEGIVITDSITNESCPISYKTFDDAKANYPKREEAVLVYRLYLKDHIRDYFDNIKENELVELTNITLNIITAKK